MVLFNLILAGEPRERYRGPVLHPRDHHVLDRQRLLHEHRDDRQPGPGRGHPQACPGHAAARLGISRGADAPGGPGGGAAGRHRGRGRAPVLRRRSCRSVSCHYCSSCWSSPGPRSAPWGWPWPPSSPTPRRHPPSSTPPCCRCTSSPTCSYAWTSRRCWPRSVTCSRSAISPTRSSRSGTRSSTHSTRSTWSGSPPGERWAWSRPPACSRGSRAA